MKALILDLEVYLNVSEVLESACFRWYTTFHMSYKSASGTSSPVEM